MKHFKFFVAMTGMLACAISILLIGTSHDNASASCIFIGFLAIYILAPLSPETP